MISLHYYLVLFASVLAVTHGTVCSIGKKNVLEEALTLHCPRPFLDDPANEYCCLNPNTNLEFHCCGALEFYLTYIIIAVVIFVVLSIILSILSCFCCPCCFFYKRRHAGNPI